MKNTIPLLLLWLILTAPPVPAADETAADPATLQRISSLFREGSFAAALELTDKAIAEQGENAVLLEARFYILLKLNRPEDALAVALRREKMDVRKTPWLPMEIAGLYLGKNDPAKAVDWLEQAVERGFNSLATLKGEEYAPLREDPRFAALLERIRQQVGIGRPARDFTVPLLDGTEFRLSGQQGKVVLIDFWATWCSPCRRAIPRIRRLYSEFHPRGLEIIGISLDRDGDALKSYIEENRLEWPITFSGRFWLDETARLYNVQSIPSLWLVDRRGILRDFDLHGDELRQAVTKLLAEK